MVVSPLPVDYDVQRTVVDYRGQPWISVAQVITVLGNTVWLGLLILLAVVVLVVARRFSAATFVGVSAVSGYYAMVGLKHAFGRDRPPAVERLVDIHNQSFPSGHAMISAICLGVLGIVAYRYVDWVRAHRWVLAIVPLASLVIGLSRIYLGVHWLTDVLAGWALGGLWVVMCVAVWNRYSKPS